MASTPDEYFRDCPLGLAVHRRLEDRFARMAPGTTVRTTKSQVAYRLGRAFAYLWRPDLYLRAAEAEVVLCIALPWKVASERFKEVIHPAKKSWMHHLELHRVQDIDHEVQRWLLAAARAAGAPPAGSVDSP